MPSSQAFGRYTLVREIGRGGMAEIWKAKVTGPSGFVKFFALKTILPDIADDRDFVAMFVDEAKLVASLSHPNLVQVFDFGEVDGRYFLAMEYIAGGSVARLLTRIEKRLIALPSELALYIALEASRGLAYAHAKTDAEGKPMHVVHRDVTPQNILLSSTGEAKLGDFGIARAASVAARTAANHVRGKLGYMSPEQVAGSALDARTDVFSLGVVMYEMIFGTRLFKLKADTGIADQLQRFDPARDPMIERLQPKVRAILVRALQPDREQRATAAELETELAGVLGATGTSKARSDLGALVQRAFRDELTIDAEDETPRAAAPTAVAIRTSRRTATWRRHLPLAAASVPLFVLTAFVVWPRAHTSHRGGTLRVANGWPPGKFDLFTSEDTRNRILMREVIEPLMKATPDGRIEAWTIDRATLNDRTLVLHVRPGVWFHDHPCLPGGHGRPATSADVAYSIRIAKDGLRLPIARIVESGEDVRIELSGAAPFYKIELLDVGLLPHELERCEDLRDLKQPVGTGPFQFASAPRDPVLALVRAPHYWRRGDHGESLPYLDAIEVQPMDDARQALARLEAGELDQVVPAGPDWTKLIDLTGPRPKLAPEYAALHGDVGFERTSRRVDLFGLYMSRADGPLRDRRVRHALALALDRAQLVAASERPLSGPNGRFFDERMLGYDPTIAALRYDPDAARALLRDVGRPRPLTIGTTQDFRLGALLVEQARRVGLEIQIVRIAQAMAQQQIETGAVDAMLLNVEWPLYDGENYNVIHSADRAHVTAALDVLRAELEVAEDPHGREALYRKVELALLDDLPMIPIAWGDMARPRSLYVFRANVHGLADPVTGFQIGDYATAWMDR